MINKIDEAILNSRKGFNNKEGNKDTNEVLYSRWEKRYAKTIKDFYNDFINPRLPDVDVLMKWNDLLLWYIDQPSAIYFLRGGNVDGKDKKCRRGWMNVLQDTSTNSSIRYIYDDNDLAAYIFKMALDGYCPEKEEFLNYMTEFKSPEDIGWLNQKSKTFNKIDKSRKYLSIPGHFTPNKDYEYDKNVLLLCAQGTIPCCLGTYGYKHSHVFDVNKPYIIDGRYYDKKQYFNIEKDDTNSYVYDPSISNYCRVRSTANNSDFELAKKFLKAHTLRFLNPYNHFLAPHQCCNKYTKNDGSFDLDIAEYERLLNYIVVERRKIYPDFVSFENRICWESLCDDEKTGDDIIDVIYHEKSYNIECFKEYRKSNGYTDKVTNIHSQNKSQKNSPKILKNNVQSQKNERFAAPEICLIPNDKNDFIEKIQKKGHATITIIKLDGTTEIKDWSCGNIAQTFNPVNNLRSKKWYRENKQSYKKIICEVK